MSLSTTASSRPRLRDHAGRLGLMLLALLAAAALFGLLAWLIMAFSPQPLPPPPRNPFGAGLPREAAPSTTGIGAVLLGLQSSFYGQMTQMLKAAREQPAALWGLLAVAFGYGVFHAAGPGHGKAVISAYIVADGHSLRRGLALSFAAALVQALVAIAMVGVVTLLLKSTSATMNLATRAIEQASFALVVVVGLWVLWRKAGAALVRHRGEAFVHDQDCDHLHLPGPAELARLRDWRAMAGIVLAAGIRPCAGALIILVFAVSQGLLGAGIAATFAMALGTALTTGALAALAVFFKFAALRLAGGGSGWGLRALTGLELLASASVVLLGAVLLAGYWGAGQGG